MEAVSELLSSHLEWATGHLRSPAHVREHYNFRQLDARLLHQIDADIEIVLRLISEHGYTIEVVDAEILLELTRIRENIMTVVESDSARRRDKLLKHPEIWS